MSWNPKTLGLLFLKDRPVMEESEFSAHIEHKVKVKNYSELKVVTLGFYVKKCYFNTVSSLV